MGHQENDKRFVTRYTIIVFVVIGIFFAVMLTLMWLGYGGFKDTDGNPIDPSLGKKITLTAVFVAFLMGAIFLSKYLYKNQEKQDHLRMRWQEKGSVKKI